MKILLRPFAALQLLLLFPIFSASAEELKEFRSAVHLHTQWSTGPMSAEEIVQLGQEHQIPILIFTDSALRRWEYTLFPWLGPLIKKTVNQPSILKMGASRYLSEIETLQKKYSQRLLIPATEVAPHYYWTGSYFKKDLTLRDWQKHLLVIGLDSASALKNLPLTSNPHRRALRWRTLLWLWPAPVLWFASKLFRIRRVRRIDLRGQVWEEKKYPFRWLAALFFLIGGACFVVNFPFTDTRYSPYGGEKGAKPYQKLIDTVRKNGGLVFWAHPEAERTNEYGAPVGIYTPPYPELLLQTRGYHGFAIFFEGYRTVGGIGGVWDQVLMEFLQGKRNEPVWALGELDFHKEILPVEKRFDEVDTVLWMPEMSREAALEALRAGKMYARWNNPRADLHLDRYDLSLAGEKKAVSGETLKGSGEVNLTCAIGCSRGGPEKVKVQVIRNGELWKTAEGMTPLTVVYPDRPAAKTYYRVFVEGKYPMYLATNPIFFDPS